MQLNSRIIILVYAPGSSVIYVFFLKVSKVAKIRNRYNQVPHLFCAMLCVYAFKQLVGENEIDYHLSAQN